MGLQYQSSNLDDASDQTSQASMVAEQDRGPSIEAQSQDAARLATELHHIVEVESKSLRTHISVMTFNRR